jgi:hypothetical protein
MTKHKAIPVLALSAAMAIPAIAASGRVSITTAQIAAAIAATGLQVSAQQVTLLAGVVAASSAPRLRVQSMEHWGIGRLKIRLDCASSDECLPFLVAVQLTGDAIAQPLLDRLSASNPHSGLTGPIVMRAGTPATLLLDGEHVHIQVAVVCLENGGQGQVIRVATKDRMQTYNAEVIDGSFLRGKL